MNRELNYYTKLYCDCTKVSICMKAYFLFNKNVFKGLPAEIQPLGNNYARDEFKRHKKCNEAEAAVFLTEWTNYAVQLSKQLGLGYRGLPKNTLGEYLQESDIDRLRDEQIVQLYELMQAATGQTNEETETNDKSDKNKS